MPEKEKQQRTLNREQIIETAYRMVDTKGYKSFNMRALGAELGVSAMAFYSHFSSNIELLAAVCSEFMDTMDTNPVPGERWDKTLVRTMGSIRREAMLHPHLSALFFDEEIASRGLEKHTQKIVTLHLEQGIPLDVFKKAWAIIDAFLTGFSLHESTTAREELFHKASGEASHQLTDWQEIYFTAYNDVSFYNGIQIIIEGIRNIAAPDPCEWYTPE